MFLHLLQETTTSEHFRHLKSYTYILFNVFGNSFLGFFKFTLTSSFQKEYVRKSFFYKKTIFKLLKIIVL